MKNNMIFKMIFYGLLCLSVLICGLYAILVLNVIVYLLVWPTYELWHILGLADFIALLCIIETFSYIIKIITKKNYKQNCLSKKCVFLLCTISIIDVLSVIEIFNYLDFNDFNRQYNKYSSSYAIFEVYPHLIAICFLICQAIRFMYYILKRNIRHPIIPESRE